MESGHPSALSSVLITGWITAAIEGKGKIIPAAVHFYSLPAPPAPPPRQRAFQIMPHTRLIDPPLHWSTFFSSKYSGSSIRSEVSAAAGGGGERQQSVESIILPASLITQPCHSLPCTPVICETCNESSFSRQKKLEGWEIVDELVLTPQWHIPMKGGSAGKRSNVTPCHFYVTFSHTLSHPVLCPDPDNWAGLGHPQILGVIFLWNSICSEVRRQDLSKYILLLCITDRVQVKLNVAFPEALSKVH